MSTRVTRARLSRAGSLLVLFSVLLLAAVGVIYLAEPAEADPVKPEPCASLR